MFQSLLSVYISQISTYVDGCIEGLCVLHHPSHDTESSGIIRNQMLLGHVMSVEEIATSSGAWKLGNVMLFRGMLIIKKFLMLTFSAVLFC